MSRTVIVTGGASGIGWATARLFCQRGDTVVIVDLHNARERAEELGQGATGHELDVTHESEVRALFDSVGRVDVLVNNAGIADSALPTLEQAFSDFRKVLDVHLGGTFLMAREAASAMTANGGGAIVNLSSIAGVVALPRRNAYGAAKAGISMMTRSMACEWAEAGVRVNAVAPGYVRTALVQKLITDRKVDVGSIQRRTPLGRLVEPDEIAAAIWFLASPAASAITGVTLSVDGGWAAFGGAGDAN